MVNCPYRPLDFASAVLPDGRVVVIGGEYNDLHKVWTNIGFMYDPVTNTWSGQITVPGTWCCAGGGHHSGGIGDAQSTILTNGTMLLASLGNPWGKDIASFDPATLTFTALAPTGDKDDDNWEENWNQLPNGRVLTVDSSPCKRTSKSTTPRPTRGGPTRIHRGELGRYRHGHSKIPRRSDQRSCGRMARLSPSLARIPVRTPSTTPQPARGLQLARRETSRSSRGRRITMPSPMALPRSCRTVMCS